MALLSAFTVAGILCQPHQILQSCSHPLKWHLVSRLTAWFHVNAALQATSLVPNPSVEVLCRWHCSWVFFFPNSRLTGAAWLNMTCHPFTGHHLYFNRTTTCVTPSEPSEHESSSCNLISMAGVNVLHTTCGHTSVFDSFKVIIASP